MSVCGHAQPALPGLQGAALKAGSVQDVQQFATQLLARSRQDLRQLSADDMVTMADTYGHLVSRLRDIGGEAGDFSQLLTLAGDLRRRCREKIRALEDATAQDEVQLEKLYRSDVWHDINYALSALGYWESWALLGIAFSKAGDRDQVSWLNRAESGFQASSVRILYPGIVYGSWLGMGYVARARGDEAAAEKRFRRLAQALVSDPKNPVREIAEAELTVIAVRRGEAIPVKPLLDEPLSPSMANVYLEQAFVLLQQHRDTGTGAIAAAARLKKLIAEGYLNNALVARILAFRDEIAGQDLGIFSLYVDAEFAYAYHQYDTAVLKYRAFIRRGGGDMLINLRTLQYHYAVALLQIDQYHDAFAMAETLRQQTDLPQLVEAALPKLSFLIARALHEQKASNRNRAQLLRAAEYFLTKSAADPDVGTAHMVLGQLSFDSERAKYHLAEAKKDARLKGSLALAQLKRAISEFNRATAADKISAQRSHAEQILSGLAELPRRQRKALWVRAVALQMRTVLNRDLAAVLKEIAQIYALAERNQDVELDASVRRVLLWSKLRALDAGSSQGELLAFIRGLAAAKMDGAEQKEVYQFLLEKERRQQMAALPELADALFPALAGQTHDQRQLRLLQIRARSALGDTLEAFRQAQAMIGEFPNSGDAWVAYAEAAEAANELFAAERAWAKVSAGQPQGAPRWRNAVNKRIELLARLGDRKDELCSAISDAQRYLHLTSSREQQALTERHAQQGCG